MVTKLAVPKLNSFGCPQKAEPKQSKQVFLTVKRCHRHCFPILLTLVWGWRFLHKCIWVLSGLFSGFLWQIYIPGWIYDHKIKFLTSFYFPLLETLLCLLKVSSDYWDFIIKLFKENFYWETIQKLWWVFSIRKNVYITHYYLELQI